jgi:hypothetical protein
MPGRPRRGHGHGQERTPPVNGSSRGDWDRAPPSGCQAAYAPFEDGMPQGAAQPVVTGFHPADEKRLYGAPALASTSRAFNARPVSVNATVAAAVHLPSPLAVASDGVTINLALMLRE